jgi:hypothetical protein
MIRILLAWLDLNAIVFFWLQLRFPPVSSRKRWIAPEMIDETVAEAERHAASKMPRQLPLEQVKQPFAGTSLRQMPQKTRQMPRFPSKPLSRAVKAKYSKYAMLQKNHGKESRRKTTGVV